MGTILIQIKELSRSFVTEELETLAVRNATLEIQKGEFVAVMGPSGSGKSTLLNIIGGLDNLSSGDVILEGERIDNLDENALVAIRRGKIAYIFQQYHLLPSLNALENVLLPLIFCGASEERTSKAMEMLKRVGLEKRIDHKPSELSGGEQQRVAIARALVNDPSLILADEPTGNMDQKTGRQILGLFDELNKDGHTIVMVTHDPEIARHSGKIIVLQDGQIVDRRNDMTTISR